MRRPPSIGSWNGGHTGYCDDCGPTQEVGCVVVRYAAVFVVSNGEWMMWVCYDFRPSFRSLSITLAATPLQLNELPHVRRLQGSWQQAIECTNLLLAWSSLLGVQVASREEHRMLIANRFLSTPGHEALHLHCHR